VTFDPLKRLLRRYGVDITGYNRHTNPRARRQYFLNRFKINIVFDVGANVGQYATRLRREGYAGQILSYEPFAQAFEVLSERARADPHWQCLPKALGREPGLGTINVAENSQLNSLLPAGDAAIDAIRFNRQETVSVSTLKDEIELHTRASDHLFVKCDTQGFEKDVLDGAGESIGRIHVLHLELSLREQYKGETLFDEMVPYLRHRGFDIVAIDTASTDLDTDLLTQVDVLLINEEAAAAHPAAGSTRK